MPTVYSKDTNPLSWTMDVPGQTTTDLVQHWGTQPDNHVPAFISFDEAGTKRQLTRKDMLHYSRRFAHKLKVLGVCPGEIVVNTLPNSLERLVADFGIQFCGAVSMNGQIFRSDGEDFLEALETSKCCMVVLDPAVKNGARDILLKEVPLGQEDCVKSTRLPHLRRLLKCARDDSHPQSDFLTSLSELSLPEFAHAVSPSDLASVMTTSGSTGYSKLVKLSHANICHFARQVKAIEPLNPGDRFINCAPLGWAGGYPQWYLGCGVTRYFLDMHDGPPSNLPVTIWRTIVEEKVVYGFLSPMYVNAILTNPSLWKDVSWKPRTLCLAGQPVKKDQLEIIGRLCDAVDINYGITECNLVTTHRITDASSYVDGCGGHPGFGVQLKIIDKDGKEVPKGATGEVIIWSPALCQGYLNNPSATESSFTADGWFLTDDAGHIGEDGKLYVEGRRSDSILRGAYILYPGWLEHKLREVEGVKDVAVVAVPDPVLHNEICAFVVTNRVEGLTAGILHRADQDGFETGLSRAGPSAGVDGRSTVTDFVDGEVRYPPWTAPCTDNFGPSSVFQRNLDQIRSEGLGRPLEVHYNKTKAKNSDSCNANFRNNVLEHQSQLQHFEMKLREHAEKLQVFSKADAMRMVPKYYVFAASLPLTGTGKISRKEIRKMSTSLLKLDSV